MPRSRAPAGTAWIGPHDNRLHPADSSAVARSPIVPGGRDSIGFDLRIDNEEEFDVASLFLEIESEGFVIERKVPLAIPRPYSQVRFDAEPDPTGVCALSWDVRLLETASLGDDQLPTLPGGCFGNTRTPAGGESGLVDP